MAVFQLNVKKEVANCKITGLPKKLVFEQLTVSANGTATISFKEVWIGIDGAEIEVPEKQKEYSRIHLAEKANDENNLVATSIFKEAIESSLQTLFNNLVTNLITE